VVVVGGMGVRVRRERERERDESERCFEKANSNQ